jgi:triacylglycerol lipase
MANFDTNYVKATDYPTLYIHGFLGVPEDQIFTKLYRYFGSFTKDLVKDLRKEGYEVYLPGLGPFNPMWERACELYAYIFGGRVDYGVVHSQKHHTKRFGRTYPGVLKDLGTPGKHAKCNLIGHSFGGPTVILFSEILTNGCQEELDATPADEVSEFFKGGKGDLLHTVTTLSGTNHGTSITYFMGDKVIEMVSRLILNAGAIAGNHIAKIYDLYFDPWGIMEDPAEWKGGPLGSINDPQKKAGVDAYATNKLGGSIAYDMKPDVCESQLANIKPNKKTYFFARPGQGTHTNKYGTASPDGHIFAPFKITAWILGNYTDKEHGIDKEWLNNDGVVNCKAMRAPTGVEQYDFVDGMAIKPGVWYNMPAQNWDHQGWAGMFISKATYYDVMGDIMRSIYSLPDA